MNLAISRSVAVVFFITSVTFAQDDMRTWMTSGIDAFRHARYAEAIQCFEHAVRLDPRSADAHVSLAVTYLQLYIAGVESPENLSSGRNAEEHLRKALEIDPENMIALGYLAQFCYGEALAKRSLAEKTEEFNQAKHFLQRIVDLDPTNRDALYTLGVVAWQKTYPRIMSARAELGVSPEDLGPLPDSNLRHSLRANMEALLDDGVRQFSRVLEIDGNYLDAMEYLNLVLREKAALSETKEEALRYTAAGDEWVQKARAKLLCGFPVSDSKLGKSAYDSILKLYVEKVNPRVMLHSPM